MITLYRDYKGFLGSSSTQPRDRRVKVASKVRGQIERAIDNLKGVYSDITGGYVEEGLVFFGYTIFKDNSVLYSFNMKSFLLHQSDAKSGMSAKEVRDYPRLNLITMGGK